MRRSAAVLPEPAPSATLYDPPADIASESHEASSSDSEDAAWQEAEERERLEALTASRRRLQEATYYQRAAYYEQRALFIPSGLRAVDVSPAPACNAVVAAAPEAQVDPAAATELEPTSYCAPVSEPALPTPTAHESPSSAPAYRPPSAALLEGGLPNYAPAEAAPPSSSEGSLTLPSKASPCAPVRLRVSPPESPRSNLDAQGLAYYRQAVVDAIQANALEEASNVTGSELPKRIKWGKPALVECSAEQLPGVLRFCFYGELGEAHLNAIRRKCAEAGAADMIPVHIIADSILSCQAPFG
jgi:hypothetical protein